MRLSQYSDDEMSNENIPIKTAILVLLGDMLLNKGRLTNMLCQIVLKQQSEGQEKRIITARRIP